jgi:hypothetical protein
MAQPDLEPVGRLERVVQPTLNRFALNAELGLDTVLSPDAAKATAQAFAVLTHTIDLMEAQRAAMRQMAITAALILGAVVVFVMMAWL